jgi:hypothetical protein
MRGQRFGVYTLSIKPNNSPLPFDMNGRFYISQMYIVINAAVLTRRLSPEDILLYLVHIFVQYPVRQIIF